MSSRRRIEAGFSAWARFVVHRRWLVIAACAALTGILVSRLGEFRVDNSDEAFLHSDDPECIRYDRFKEQFDREDRIMVLLHPAQVFDLAFLERLRALHRDIENEVPLLEEATSLVNARHTRGEQDELLVGDLMEEWPETPKALAALRETVLASSLYRNQLISEDGGITTLVVQLQAFASMETEDEALADARLFGAVAWRVLRRCRDQPRDQGRLGQGELGHGLFEVALSGCLDAVGAGAEIDLVEIQEEDLVLL